MGKDLNRASTPLIVKVIREHMDAGQHASADLVLSYAETLRGFPDWAITPEQVNEAAKRAIRPVTLSADTLRADTRALKESAKDPRVKGRL